MSDVPVRDERPLRISTTGSRFYALFINTVIFAFPMGWSIALLSSGSHRLIATLMATAVFGVAGFVLWRVARLATVFKPHEIIVRNWYRTHRIPWSDVGGFIDSSVVAGEGGTNKWALGIQTREGLIKCQSTSWAMTTAYTMAMLNEIRQEAASHGVSISCVDP
jgi:hypothetical protein